MRTALAGPAHATMQEVSEPAPALPLQPSTHELIHSLNNQLTVVLAHSECALGSDDPEQLHRALRAILQSATKMADSVRGLSRNVARASIGNPVALERESS